MSYLKLDGNVVHSSWNHKVYVLDISGSTGFTETNNEFNKTIVFHFPNGEHKIVCDNDYDTEFLSNFYVQKYVKKYEKTYLLKYLNKSGN